jgi:hypothetical protein
MNGVVACTITDPSSGLYAMLRIYRLPGWEPKNATDPFQGGSWDWIGGTFNYIESPNPRRWGYLHVQGTGLPISPGWEDDVLRIYSFRLYAPMMSQELALHQVPKNFLDTVPSNPINGEGETGYPAIKLNWSIWFRTDPI